MKRVALTLLLVYLALNVHVYGLGGSFNSGAYFTFRPYGFYDTYGRYHTHFCGVEWRGTPGTFCDVDY